MILRVTDIPPSLNKVLRMHWKKKHGLLNAWRWMIKVAFGHPLALCDGKRRVKITLFHSRFYDKDNAYGACKVIFDALKAEGFIVDDRAQWLEAKVEQEKCKHKERHTVIEIEGYGVAGGPGARRGRHMSECPVRALKTTEPLPSRMQKLPVDERGYVVPWFVDWLDGKPEFRAMDMKKWARAVREKLCWVCGERLGRYATFVAGPMCGINRTSSEPPSHLECAQWSARNCPFLSNSQAIRRVDEVIGADMSHVAGIALTRNPGVAMLWTTRTWSVFPDGKGRMLLTFGDPEHVEWYAEGKPATREQVMASIESGLPALAAIAQQQDGAMKYLMECRARFEKFVPA